VAIENPVVLQARLAATATGNLFRGEEISTVQGNQQGVVDRAKSRQIALLVQGIANLGHDRVHRFRRHRVQQIANLVIAGNLMHPEQRRGIVPPQLLLHPDLAIEEGRTLREKHGEGRQGRILHLIEPGVALLTPVRQSPECIPNLLDQGDGGARQGNGGNGRNGLGT
jgi:hypothetical protein